MAQVLTTEKGVEGASSRARARYLERTPTPTSFRDYDMMAVQNGRLGAGPGLGFINVELAP